LTCALDIKAKKSSDVKSAILMTSVLFVFQV